MSFEFEYFRNTIKRVSNARLFNLGRYLGWDGGSPPGQVVEPHHAMVIWFAATAELDLPVDTVDMILHGFRDNIRKYARELAKAISDLSVTMPVARLVVADSRYVMLTGSEDVLSVADGKFVKVLPYAETKSLGYNLCQVYMNGRRWYETRKTAE